MTDTDTDMGRPTAVTVDDVLEAVDAREVADHLGANDRTVQRRMREMADDRYLLRKRAGYRTMLYWESPFPWMGPD